MILTVFIALLWAAAGFCIFLFAYNRVIAHLRSVRLKLPLMAASLLVFTAGAGLCGVMAGRTPWTSFPVVVLVFAIVQDVVRMARHRRCLAEGPVEEHNAGLSLLGPITTTNLAVRRYEVPLPGWGGGRTRIVQLTDLHVQAGFPMEYYHGVMERVRELNPDLLVLTGDYLSRGQALPLLKRALTGAEARLGCYAILGNHDVWQDAAGITEVLRSCGFQRLPDTWERIETSPGHTLVLSGCEHPWGGRRWTPPPAGPSEPVLVLTHTPENIPRISDTGATAVFAGHYHAGQAVLPLLGPIIVPARSGRLFYHGHFLVDGTHLFVNAGVGCAFPPVRVYCQPEIIAVDLVRA